MLINDKSIFNYFKRIFKDKQLVHPVYSNQYLYISIQNFDTKKRGLIFQKLDQYTYFDYGNFILIETKTNEFAKEFVKML